MTARVLVVDDILANVKLLEAKLLAEYYIVLTAMSGEEALRVAKQEKPDLILLDIMMPVMDGFEVCRRLKADPELAHIPVVMVTALDQPSHRVEGLEAGADDFLTKPPNDLALLARVSSLVRVKMMIEQLKLRDETYRGLGFEAPRFDPTAATPSGSVMLVDDRASVNKSMSMVISTRLGVPCRRVSNAAELEEALKHGAPDILVVNANLGEEDGLRICSKLRTTPETRHSSILIMVEHGDYATIAKSLDLGANDYIMRPVDENELVVRVRAQLLRKHYADKLRENVHSGLRMAVTDPLTGLYNRRYAEPHLNALAERSIAEGAPMAALLLDIDKFKSVNDTYGHAVGDEVLTEFARRLMENVRGVDLAARIGGEEFLVIMPDTRVEMATSVAERLRAAIAERKFQVSAPLGELAITVSIGVATGRGEGDTPEALLERADMALYQSKHDGRNRVTLQAA